MQDNFKINPIISIWVHLSQIENFYRGNPVTEFEYDILPLMDENYVNVLVPYDYFLSIIPLRIVKNKKTQEKEIELQDDDLPF